MRTAAEKREDDNELDSRHEGLAYGLMKATRGMGSELHAGSKSRLQLRGPNEPQPVVCSGRAIIRDGQTCVTPRGVESWVFRYRLNRFAEWLRFSCSS
jgi:hypothetical protein